ncbi:MAG: cyclic nucleotide-binding domain-containing protein [Proteobacteria bacterium]|nr:cyclic nucleotide-binding domain-containing protein [Pseudomonadota bacterium]
MTEDSAIETLKRRTGLIEADLEVLRRHPVFSGLPGNVIATLLAEATVKDFPRHAVLFLQDEPATHFYVIFDGWVKLFRQTPDGQESVIAVFGRGESFAEAAIFESQDFPVSAEVVEGARLLVVPAAPFLKCLREDVTIALNILASMSRHLRGLVRHVEQLTVKSSAERLAVFLLRLCPRGASSAVIRLPLDKSLIAGRLGMQPETLSRSLAKLRRIGVRTRGSEVIVANVVALKGMSEGRPAERASCA